MDETIQNTPASGLGFPDARAVEKARRQAFLLSFFLPGLGQVFQRHYRRGAALFAGFSLLTLISEARWFLPVAAFLAAMEAYRGQRANEMGPSPTPDLSDLPGAQHLPDTWKKKLLRSPGEGRYRTALFAIVGVFGFCAWIGLFAPVIYPFREQAELNDKVDEIADRVRQYEVDHGTLPDALDEVFVREGAEDIGIEKDPWGTPFQYTETDEGFEIRSAGKDRKMNTADDYVYHFKE